MYIIFNQDGSVNKQILNDFIQQGDNNVKTIFVTVLGVDTEYYQVGAVATLPDKTLITLPSENAELEIDGVTYLGKNVIINSDATILEGIIHINLVITDNNRTLVTYNFYLTINETGLGADDIIGMTVSEYEHLLGAIGGKLDINKSFYVISDRTISATQFSEGQLVYSKADKLFYRVTNNAYVLEQVDIGSINVGGDTLANRLSTLAGDISDLEGDVNALDTNKADKIGALPHIIIPANTKVHQFINTHSLDNSPFVFILNNVPYFATMRTSGSFEIERCDNGQTLSAYRWTGTFDNNQTFEEIIVDANLDNYEQENNKVNSISSSSTDTQYPSAKCLYNVQQALTLGIDSSGHSIVATINPTTYVMTIVLKDAFGNALGTAQNIDLPLESIVVSAEYRDNYSYGGVDYEKVIVITLATTDVPTIVPVGALVDGLVDENTLNQTLQPYIKSKVVNSVLTTGDLLTEFGVGKEFVLDVMGDILLCYINETENEGYYTMSVIDKHSAYTTQQFTNAELVTNILGTGTLEIDYLPIITLTNGTQTLNSNQLQVANQDNSVIKYNDRLYHKCNDSGTNLEFVCIDYDIVDEGANQKLTKYEILVNKSTGATSMITSYTEFYSKSESDALLDEKANVDGNYPTMTVGAADNLTPYGENSGVEGTTPFVMQTAGGSSDIASQAYLKSLCGNSVNFNQLSRNGNFVNTDYWTASSATISASNNELSIVATAQFGHAFYEFDAIKDHEYIFILEYEKDFSGQEFNGNVFIQQDGVVQKNVDFEDTTNKTLVYFKYTAVSTNTIRLAVANSNASNWGTIKISNVKITDLTQMYNGVNKPTSEINFIRDYPKPYYDYTLSQLLSSKVNGIKNVGYNAYDNSNPNNFIRVVNGQPYTLEGTYTSVELYDYNKDLLADTFTNEVALPNNCCFVKIIGGDNTTCFYLTHDGSKTGYEPYKAETYALPNIELRSAGNTYDEIKPNGTLITRIGVIDLGTLNWTRAQFSTNYMFYSMGISNLIKTYNDFGKVAIVKIGNNFEVTSANVVENGNINNAVSIRYTTDEYSGAIEIRCDTYTNADDFKNAMANVYLFYELATPIGTQNDNYKFDELMPIDDWGTQEFLYDSNIAIPIPQGNDFFYPVDYKAFIDTLGDREDINYDASKIVSQEQLADDLSGYATTDQIIPQWFGTQAQYDALGTYDSNTIYNILES